MRSSRRQFCASALAFAAFPASRFATTKGQQVFTADGRPLLLRGINLGNWLEPEGYMFLFDDGPQSPSEIEALVFELIGPEGSASFWNSFRKNYINQSDLRFIRQCGFNSVRIPLHFKLFAEGAEGFTLLDPIVAACRELGLWAILDMHCAPGGQTGTNIDDSSNYPWLFESEQCQRLLTDIWAHVAQHYRNEPAVLGYDLLNEPLPHFPKMRKYDSLLEPLYKRLTAAIRKEDRNHIVILGGAQWDSAFNVFGKPFDDKLLYTFHKYWTPPTRASIDEYLSFRAKYNVPVWLGESGENSDEWIGQFVKTLEENNVGWCFWPYKKMQKNSCVVSISKPSGWDEITAFAKKPGGTAAAEKRIAARPAQDIIKRAFDELAATCRLEACQVNEGYIRALGLNPARI